MAIDSPQPNAQHADPALPASAPAEAEGQRSLRERRHLLRFLLRLGHLLLATGAATGMVETTLRGVA